MQDDDGYCSIFACAPPDEVKALLASRLGLSFAHSVGTNAGGELSVLKNGYRAPAAHVATPSDFLAWDTKIDIEPETRSNASDAFVTSVLQTLWSDRISAVAACDYEDGLPHGGSRYFDAG